MDISLKQRLIGAVVLVTLAVIFLPMLVKGPAPTGVRDVPLRAPDAPDTGQFETRELPLAAPTAPAAGNAANAPAALPGPATNAPAAATGNSALPPAVAAGNYAVNFGAYASQVDADVVIAGLKQANLPGFSQPDTINGKPAWRVRVGPYADRAQAELARLQAVKVRSDVNAQVVVLDADKEPVPDSAQSAAAQAAPAATVGAPPTRVASPATSTATVSVPPARTPSAAQTTTTATATAAVARPKPATPKPATATASPARVTTTASAAPAASAVGFAVQLGAFSQLADANALRDKARAAGFSAFVEQVRTDNGMLQRVRVGPVASRAEAEQLRAQVAVKIGISGMVRPHP